MLGWWVSGPIQGLRLVIVRQIETKVLRTGDFRNHLRLDAKDSHSSAAMAEGATSRVGMRCRSRNASASRW